MIENGKLKIENEERRQTFKIVMIFYDLRLKAVANLNLQELDQSAKS